MIPSGHDSPRCRRAYAVFNLLTAATGVYLLLTPWILPAVEAMVPGDRPLSCAGRGPGAERCSLCGLTRGFRAVWRGDFEPARQFHPRAPLLFAMTAGETALRLSFLLALRASRLRTASLVRVDAGLHAAALAAWAARLRPA